MVPVLARIVEPEPEVHAPLVAQAQEHIDQIDGRFVTPLLGREQCLELRNTKTTIPRRQLTCNIRVKLADGTGGQASDMPSGFYPTRWIAALSPIHIPQTKMPSHPYQMYYEATENSLLFPSFTIKSIAQILKLHQFP